MPKNCTRSGINCSGVSMVGSYSARGEGNGWGRSDKNTAWFTASTVERFPSPEAGISAKAEMAAVEAKPYMVYPRRKQVGSEEAYVAAVAAKIKVGY